MLNPANCINKHRPGCSCSQQDIYKLCKEGLRWRRQETLIMNLIRNFPELWNWLWTKKLEEGSCLICHNTVTGISVLWGVDGLLFQCTYTCLQFYLNIAVFIALLFQQQQMPQFAHLMCSKTSPGSPHHLPPDGTYAYLTYQHQTSLEDQGIDVQVNDTSVP